MLKYFSVKISIRCKKFCNDNHIHSEYITKSVGAHNHIHSTYTTISRARTHHIHGRYTTISMAAHNHIHGGYITISMLDTQPCTWQNGGYTTISMVGKQPCPWQYTSVSMAGTLATISMMAHNHVHGGTQSYLWRLHNHIHGWETTIFMAGTEPY